MKVLIIYFSATGNTKYGVDLIKHGIEEENDSTCDCIDINKFSKNSISNYDIIGFACPVFAFKPTLNMLDLIKDLPDGNNKPCFTLVSYAGDLSNTFWILRKELKKLNYVCIAQKEMLAQGSWTTARIPGKLDCENEPSESTQQDIIEFGRGLSHILGKHKSNSLIDTMPKFHFGILHIISYLYNDFVLRNFFSSRVCVVKCTKCGRCVKDCPTGRMRFDKFPNPKGKCVGCYRCINFCPENAIKGWFTENKLQYKGLHESIKILHKKV